MRVTGPKVFRGKDPDKLMANQKFTDFMRQALEMEGAFERLQSSISMRTKAGGGAFERVETLFNAPVTGFEVVQRSIQRGSLGGLCEEGFRTNHTSIVVHCGEPDRDRNHTRAYGSRIIDSAKRS